MTLASYLFAPDPSDSSDAAERHSAASTRRVGRSNGEDSRADNENLVAQDQALLVRIRAGDTEAFHDLYVEHYALLLDVAHGVVRARDVAEDVVQQVFVELWERRAAWQPRQLRPSLIRAVRYRALDQWRRRRKFAALDAAASFAVPGDLEGRSDHIMLEHALVEALGALPERRRTALLLRAVRNLSYAEIGEALEVSEKAAFLLVSRARTALEPIRRRFLELLEG